MESVQFAEYLYKAVVYYIHRFIIPVYIPENNFQAISIVPLVKRFLIALVLLNATCNYFVEEFQCSSLYGRYAVTVQTVALYFGSLKNSKSTWLFLPET